jgi:hypothetical protein
MKFTGNFCFLGKFLAEFSLGICKPNFAHVLDGHCARIVRKCSTRTAFPAKKFCLTKT